jgi:hypothetical protein
MFPAGQSDPLQQFGGLLLRFVTPQFQRDLHVLLGGESRDQME